MPRERGIIVTVHTEIVSLSGGVRIIRYIKESVDDENPLYVARDIINIMADTCRRTHGARFVRRYAKYKMCIIQAFPVNRQVCVDGIENSNLRFIDVSDKISLVEDVRDHIFACSSCQVLFMRMDPRSESEGEAVQSEEEAVQSEGEQYPQSDSSSSDEPVEEEQPAPVKSEYSSEEEIGTRRLKRKIIHDDSSDEDIIDLTK